MTVISTRKMSNAAVMGRGSNALKCANCHQDTNLPGENMPPGNPNWHLPPPEMPLVFQGKTARELAQQLKDPARTAAGAWNSFYTT